MKIGRCIREILGTLALGFTAGASLVICVRSSEAAARWIGEAVEQIIHLIRYGI